MSYKVRYISVKNSDGSQYFSNDWVNENILGIKDKAKDRKKKIKKNNLKNIKR